MQVDHTTDTNKDFIGSIDRSIIGFGLAAIALIPTLFLTLFRPAKLWSLIEADHPKGRAGYILSPGIFFLLTISVHSLILSRVIGDGSAVQMSKSVDDAVQGANVGQILLSLSPAFLGTLFVTILIWLVTRFTFKDWTIQHSIRTALYIIPAQLWLTMPIERLTSFLGEVGSMGRVVGIVILYAAYMFVWFSVIFRQFTADKPSKAFLPAVIIGLVWGAAIYFNYHGAKVIMSAL